MLRLLLLTAVSVANAQFPSLPFQFPPMPQTNGAQFQPLGQPAPQQIPLQFPSFQQKYPAVVMPYVPKHRKNARMKTKHHRRRTPKKVIDSNSDSSEEETRRSNRGRRRQVLTPVISYVTKDGYVVYQKRVQRERARDWLDIGREADELES